MAQKFCAGGEHRSTQSRIIGDAADDFVCSRLERAQQMQASIDALEEAIAALESFDADDIGETLERAAA